VVCLTSPKNGVKIAQLKELEFSGFKPALFAGVKSWGLLVLVSQSTNEVKICFSQFLKLSCQRRFYSMSGFYKGMRNEIPLGKDNLLSNHKRDESRKKSSRLPVGSHLNYQNTSVFFTKRFFFFTQLSVGLLLPAAELQFTLQGTL
jgi:hypothetical protein